MKLRKSIIAAAAAAVLGTTGALAMPAVASAHSTLDTKGGMLYGTGNESSSGFSNGKVTGGTGSFNGATGTITAKDISKTKTAVTIKYST